jgi:cobalt-zinc-cadmium efflux system outer membrane protein
MAAKRMQIIPLFGVFLLAGCAMQRYQPSPIHPETIVSQFEMRSLSDDGLRKFEEKNLNQQVPWPPKTWDLQTLSLAALYFNPALSVARARVDRADAAVVTASARPNPTVGISPGVPSPYLLTLDFSVPIETAGKRGYRVQSARNLDQAARLDLADSSWTVLSGVRLALLNYLLASRSLEIARSEEQFRTDQVNILEKILSVGEITRIDVNLARIELSKTKVAIHAAEGQTAESKAALAAAIGIPLEGLRDAEFSWTDMDMLPSSESLSGAEIRRDAVLNRMDVRRSLAQYAASEADLRLEIAKQYPDINLGPGYTYEERNSFFTVGLSSAIPLFNQNQGPIAEAEARRKEAAASFLQTQAQVIAKSERALTVYMAALQEVTETQSLYQLQETQLRTVGQSIRSGADNRLSLDGVRIQLTLLERARLDALARAQRALGDLEDAVQRPLNHEGVFQIEPGSPALNEVSEGLNQ